MLKKSVRTILNGLSVAVFVIDAKQVIRFGNIAAQNRFGSDLTDMELANVIPSPKCRNAARRVLEGETTVSLELTLQDVVPTTFRLIITRLDTERTGEKARATLDQIALAAEAAGPVSFEDYRTIQRAVFASEQVRSEGYLPDPRVAIWGQLEARIQTADLVILGGLNEGSWPAFASPDPWLSRPMRRALGLQSPERLIGLSAHDFQQAACNQRVILSRALRDGDAPSVASRWLTRLENLLMGIGAEGTKALNAAREKGAHWESLANALDQVGAGAFAQAFHHAGALLPGGRIDLHFDQFVVFKAKLVDVDRRDRCEFDDL